jgi:hypothetical protein
MLVGLLIVFEIDRQAQSLMGHSEVDKNMDTGRKIYWFKKHQLRYALMHIRVLSVSASFLLFQARRISIITGSWVAINVPFFLGICLTISKKALLLERVVDNPATY